MDNGLSPEEHARYLEVEKSTSRQLMIVFGVRLLFLTSFILILNTILKDYHPGLLFRILFVLTLLFFFGGFITNLIVYFGASHSEDAGQEGDGYLIQTGIDSRDGVEMGVFKKITTPTYLRIRKIRQEKLEDFLNSKNPKLRRVTRYGLDHPNVYDIYRGLIHLILTPVRKFIIFIFSPIGNLINQARYKQILEEASGNDNLARRVAIPKLADFPGDETLNVLIRLADDRAVDIRYLAIETLWKINDKRTIKPLIEAYKKETDCFNRIMISLSLISQGDISTFDTLFDEIAQNSIDNDHWDMTDLVYSGLISNLKQEGIPYLEEGLRHPDRYVRWIALRVIDDLAQNDPMILKEYSYLKKDPFMEIQQLYSELLNSSMRKHTT